MNSLYELDKYILFFFNQTIRNGIFDTFFVFMSDRRSVWVLIPVIASYIYIMYRKKRLSGYKKLITAVLVAGIAVGISDILGARVIKPYFARPRPCQVLEGLYFWRERAGLWVLTDGISSFKSSFSFISNHAANSMAAAAVMSLFYKKMSAVFITVSIIIGISRMYLGVHYPSDVFSGWVFGALTGFLIFRASGRFAGRNND